MLCLSRKLTTTDIPIPENVVDVDRMGTRVDLRKSAIKG